MNSATQDPVLYKIMDYVRKQMKLNHKGGKILEMEIGVNDNLWCHFTGSIGNLVIDIINIYPQIRVWNMSLEPDYFNVVFTTGTSLSESYVTYKG